MNQLLTVDTRFGTSTALFNTIHKRLITVMCGDEDVTASLLEWERNSLQQRMVTGTPKPLKPHASSLLASVHSSSLYTAETVRAAALKWLPRSQAGWPRQDRIRIAIIR